jgi:hypothetical protein
MGRFAVAASGCVLAALLAGVGPAAARQADGACVPPCRAGYACVGGVCRSPCNPPCAGDEVCTKSGLCLPRDPPPEPPVQAGAPAVTPRRSGTAPAAEAEEVEVDDVRNFALVWNPAALLIGLFSGLYGIVFDLQVGGAYVALDLQATVVLGLVTGAQGEIGLRVTPMGRGLHGFYLLPRVGYGIVEFTAAGEIGYQWFFRHFVLAIGGGVVWSSEVGVLPFGNLAIGFGF